MAQTTPANGQDNSQNAAPQLMLQKIYIKDSSFEVPNAPQIFQQIGESEQEPQVELNLSQQGTDLSGGSHEVVLTLTLTCKLGEHTAYLAEIHQAGIFVVSGFNETDQAGILGSYCPNLLFPYARQTISSMILDGGFPPFLLQPINFDAIYAEQQQRMATDADASPTLNS